MNSFKFRPQLESMDERIVPDAGPVAAPEPAPAVAAEAKPPATPAPVAIKDLTDAQLAAKKAELEAKIKDLDSQIKAMTVNRDDAHKDWQDAEAAYDAVTLEIVALRKAIDKMDPNSREARDKQLEIEFALKRQEKLGVVKDTYFKAFSRIVTRRDELLKQRTAAQAELDAVNKEISDRDAKKQAPPAKPDETTTSA